MLRRRSSKVFIGTALSLGLFFVLTVPAAGFALDLGATQTFSVDSSFDADKRTSLTATLRAVGNNVYFWVDDRYWMNLSGNEQQTYQQALNTLVQEFDNTIAPRERAFFGSEPNPGLDADPRIHVLLENLNQSAGGYFNPNDLFSRSRDPESNERELINLNARHVTIGRSKSFLAHEFQHLISSNQKELRLNRADEVWLNELRSEYATTLVGYNTPFEGSNLQSRVQGFLKKPNDSLTEWANQSEDYGIVMMFAQYLADHYGEGVLRLALASSKAGIPSIEEALGQVGSAEKFADVFQNWAIANVINSPSAGSGRYAYKQQDLRAMRISPNASFALGSGQTAAISQGTAPWAAWTYRFVGGGGALQLSFRGAAPTGSLFRVVAVIEQADGRYDIKPVRMKDEVGSLIVPDLGSAARSVQVIAFDTLKTVGFTDKEPQAQFTLTAQMVNVELPTITTVRPFEASTGTILSIEGRNFQPGSRVFFNGLETNRVVVTSGTALEATVPAGLSGLVAIEIVGPSGATVVKTDSVNINAASANSPPVVSVAPPPAQAAPQTIVTIPDGALIRTRGDFKVWIVKAGFRRHITSAKIFSFYRHLGFEKVIEVEADILNRYAESRLIRAVGDTRVYEIDSTGRKRWLQMTAGQFFSSGRRAEAIFDINTAERNFYRTGAAITR
ncbi:IPT/TIG domain-containing protein [Candidatus Parcubacteria bacterium]|nr:IPT/TIG domain-containing protein [Candidatus Parcubacteria bacterium]